MNRDARSTFWLLGLSRQSPSHNSRQTVENPPYPMSITNSYIQAAALLIGTIVIIGFTNDQLARKHPSDVRIVWYLFGLSATTSLVLAHWAHGYGVIDSAGNFQGTAGSVLNFFLKASLDIRSSLLFCLAIIAVFLVPQIVSYLVSGLSGCAAAPLFMSATVSFFFWGLIKSLAVASGVLLVIPLYAYIIRWSNSNIDQALGMVLLSTTLIAFAFSALVAYREILHLPEFLNRVLPTRLQKFFTVTKLWLTRRSHPPTS